MHRGWICTAAVIAMLLTDGTALARNHSLPQRTDPPPLPYRLDGVADTPVANPDAQRDGDLSGPRQTTRTTQPPGSVKDGYYYPPPVTVTTVIEYQRR